MSIKMRLYINIMKKKFLDSKSYEKVPVNKLILLGIYLLTSKNKGPNQKCKFEALVKECFTLFPKVFALSHYPKWPDTRKLDRPLRALRKRKMINGDSKTFFVLTGLGKREVKKITKTFRQKRLL